MNAITEAPASTASVELTREIQRLRAELRARTSELQAYRRSVAAAIAAERRRIERDLHDGTQQRLVSLAMSLGLLEAKLPGDPDAAKPIASDARRALAEALEELRQLSHRIQPPALTERGLPAALEDLASRAAFPVHLELSIDTPLPPDVETAAYFIVSEALTNAAKHSHATQVRILVSRQRGVLTVEVADDGIGGARPDRGSGLRGLTARVNALAGRLSVTSGVERGVTLRAELPCGRAPGDCGLPWPASIAGTVNPQNRRSK